MSHDEAMRKGREYVRAWEHGREGKLLTREELGECLVAFESVIASQHDTIEQLQRHFNASAHAEMRRGA